MTRFARGRASGRGGVAGGGGGYRAGSGVQDTRRRARARVHGATEQMQIVVRSTGRTQTIGATLGAAERKEAGHELSVLDTSGRHLLSTSVSECDCLSVPKIKTGIVRQS